MNPWRKLSKNVQQNPCKNLRIILERIFGGITEGVPEKFLYESQEELKKKS